MQDDVLFGEAMIGSHCRMIVHCLSCLDSSNKTRHPYHLPWIFICSTLTHDLPWFWKISNIIPQHLILWDEVLLGSSMIYSICHMIFALHDTSRQQYGHSSQLWVFVTLTHFLPWFWKVSNIIPKKICLYGLKFYWVV